LVLLAKVMRHTNTAQRVEAMARVGWKDLEHSMTTPPMVSMLPPRVANVEAVNHVVRVALHETNIARNVRRVFIQITVQRAYLAMPRRRNVLM